MLKLLLFTTFVVDVIFFVTASTVATATSSDGGNATATVASGPSSTGAANATSCGGDDNAQNGCGNCRKTCKNNNSTEQIYCLQYCDPNGCDCKEGFILDENTRKCVSPKDCTPTCGLDEYFDTCANGGCHDARTCQELDTLNGTYICEDVDVCKPGCLCNDGLLRNKEGKCVPENECPNSKCKGNFETYVKCDDANCMPKTCDLVGFPLNCTSSPDSSCAGKPGCICRNGYVKNKPGKCIPKDQCLSCGGDPNAISSACGGHCGNRCSDYNKGPVACPLICEINSCQCKKGYVYDDNIKKCGLPEKCTQTCGKDEKFTTCVEGGCVSAARNCSQIKPGQNVSYICIDTIKCTPGCICQDGFFKNNNEVCVSKDECLNNDQCGKNEVYDKCVTNCPPRKCGIDDAIVRCAAPNPADCKAGCRCADGFSRNDKGECVAPEDCPISCGGDFNAQPGCGGHCGNRCSNYNKTSVACTLSCQVNGCDCKKGYVYDDNIKKCVLPEKCTQTCGKNEKFTTCVEGGCVSAARNCSQIKPGQNVSYICIDTIKCTPGCICQDGFFRNNNEVCVSKDECLNNACNGDENAKPGCGCRRTCSDFILNKQPTCTKICKINACDCKDGYVLEEKSGKCVYPKDCPVSSASCPKGQTLGCGDNCNRKCSNFRNGTSPYACARIACSGIGSSCQCDPSQGYYYDDNKKKCVPSCECPP